MKNTPLLLIVILLVSLAACTPAATAFPGAANKPPGPLSPSAAEATVAATATLPAPQDIGSMLPIPAGPFQMGCDPAHNAGEACNDKKGVGADLHSISLDAYQIDKYEVTNKSYAQCVAAGGCSRPADPSSPTRPDYYDNPDFADYPVMNVEWNQADAYCAWAGKRLPTEAEWEKAGRGSGDTRLYPWGDQPPTCSLANFGGDSGCAGDTSAVGTHPAGASPYGVQDMAGNVREWVADWWYTNYSLYSSISNPLGPITGDYKVSRGGDWNSTDLGVSHRGDPRPNLSPLAAPQPAADIGFRCAASTRAESGAAIPAGTPPAATTMPAFQVDHPAAGKANAVGRVMWKDQPESGIKVQLCTDISIASYGSSSCSGGAQASTKTDDQGIYHFLDVPPSQYVVLANVPDSDTWVFFTTPAPTNDPYSGPDRAKPVKFTFIDGQTTVIPDISIYKRDLKLISPSDEEVISEVPTLHWEAYPGAAYYGVGRGYGSDAGEKVLTNSLKLTTLMQNCDYRWIVEAYNRQGEKISEARNWSTFHLVGQVSACRVQMIDPAADAQLPAGQPIQFSWQPNALATDYEIYISDSPNPFNRVTAPNYILEAGLPAGSHDWKITAYKDNETIASSDYGHFEVTDASQTPAASASPPTATPNSVQARDFPMLFIPAGPFQMGGNKCMVMSGGNCLKWVPGDDDPPHSLTLDAYKIDATEVTNAQYAACVAAGMCRPRDPVSVDIPGNHYGISSYADYPVTDVTWYDARAFCAWRGTRLPSEAEWEKAARGGLSGQMYPWGNEEPVCKLGAKNGAQTGYCRPSDTIGVASFAPNAYGLFDMSGNVAEWTNDWYQADYYSQSPASNPTGPESGENRVIRGGGFQARHDFRGGALSVYVRGYGPPTFGFPYLGFRCAVDGGG